MTTDQRASRARELNTMTRAELARLYLTQPWCLMTAGDISRWAKADLITSLLDAEYGYAS